MRFGTVLLVSVVVMVAGTRTLAQLRPDFSGTWEYVSTSPAGAFDTNAPELVIAQDNSRLIVTEAGGDTFAYAIDGSESRNETRSVTGERWAHVSTARWVSSAFVVTTATTRESIGRPWDHMRMYFLDPVTRDLKIAKLDAVLSPGPVMSLRTATYRRPSP